MQLPPLQGDEPGNLASIARRLANPKRLSARRWRVAVGMGFEPNCKPIRLLPPLQGEGWGGDGFGAKLQGNPFTPSPSRGGLGWGWVQVLNHDRRLIRPAQSLRKSMTDAERALWKQIKSEQLGVKFRRQHPCMGYVLDFVALEQKLVVEVDGGQHAEQSSYDAQRTSTLEGAGFRVLRFWNNQVLNELDAVLAVIFEATRTPSPPQPSP